MKIVNETHIPSEHRRSPHGAYELFRKPIALALGGLKDIGRWGGGIPFDIEMATLPPGKMNYPLHSHAAQTEYYMIVSGRGVVLDQEGNAFDIGAGDHFVTRPGVAHQIRASPESELVYYVIADNPPADVISYPKTGKRFIKPENRFLEVKDSEYYAEGE